MRTSSSLTEGWEGAMEDGWASCLFSDPQRTIEISTARMEAFQKGCYIYEISLNSTPFGQPQ